MGTTHATDIESLVNRAVEQGLPPYLLREIDLVVFPRKIDGQRYVGEVIELIDEATFRDLDGEGCGVVRKEGGAVYWNRIASRTPEGDFTFEYDHPDFGDDGHDCGVKTFARIAELTDSDPGEIEAEFRRKHRYVEHLVQEGIDEFDTLFELLADLQTNEAATVERLRRQATEADQSTDETATPGTGSPTDYTGGQSTREVD